jgi:hypothetical protein
MYFCRVKWVKERKVFIIIFVFVPLVIFANNNNFTIFTLFSVYIIDLYIFFLGKNKIFRVEKWTILKVEIQEELSWILRISFHNPEYCLVNWRIFFMIHCMYKTNYMNKREKKKKGEKLEFLHSKWDIK